MGARDDGGEIAVLAGQSLLLTVIGKNLYLKLEVDERMTATNTELIPR